MTGDELKSAMKRLGLSSRGLAEVLRLGANGDVTVRRWLRGNPPISGPASVAIEALLSGWRPDDATGAATPRGQA